jgi:hypothetical protein
MNTKEHLLDIALQEEVHILAPKLRFYDMDRSPLSNNASHREDNIRIEEAVRLFPDKDLPDLNSEQLTKLGIAWEFIWGKPVPSEIVKQKKILQELADRSPSELTPLQRLWLNIAAIDTDSF